MDTFDASIFGQVPEDVVQAALRVNEWLTHNNIKSATIAGLVWGSGELTELEDTRRMLDATRKLLAAKEKDLADANRLVEALRKNLRGEAEYHANPKVVIQPYNKGRAKVAAQFLAGLLANKDQSKHSDYELIEQAYSLADKFMGANNG